MNMQKRIRLVAEYNVALQKFYGAVGTMLSVASVPSQIVDQEAHLAEVEAALAELRRNLEAAKECV